MILDEQDSATLKAWSGFETALDEFEDVLYASDKDWNIISSKIDVQSFADYYLISEWVENWDTLQKQYLLLPGRCRRCAAYGPRVGL